MNLTRAISIAKTGYDVWAGKPHNKRWAKLIDGTPIPNDLAVCIAHEFSLILGLQDLAQGPEALTHPEASRHADGWTVGGLHRPTVGVVLQMMQNKMAEGERMGLKVGTLREAIEDAERVSRHPDALSPPEVRSALVDAARAMADDYQTSPNHHPQHVLVPLAAFEAMRAALSHPDPLTVGETSRQVDGGGHGS